MKFEETAKKMGRFAAQYLKYAPVIDKYAKKYGVDPIIIVAIMVEESQMGLDPNAHYIAGCDPTKAPRDDPENNIECAARVLRNWLDKTNDNYEKTIQIYNGEKGREAYAKRVLANRNAWVS